MVQFSVQEFCFTLQLICCFRILAIYSVGQTFSLSLCNIVYIPTICKVNFLETDYGVYTVRVEGKLAQADAQWSHFVESVSKILLQDNFQVKFIKFVPWWAVI